MIEFLEWFVASFISTLGITIMYYKVNKLKFHLDLKIVITFFISVFVISVIQFYDVTIFNFLVYFFFFPFLFYFIKFESVKKLIYDVIIIWLFGILLDLLTMLIISLIDICIDVDIYANSFTIVPSIIIFTMYVLFTNCKKVLNFIDSFYKQICRIRYYDFIIVVISIFTLLCAVVLAINIHKITVGLLLPFTVFSVLLVFITGIKMKFLDYEYNIFLNTLRENNNFYIKMDEENRMFKHNLLANLLAVKSVSNKASRDLINELINNLNYNVDFLNQLKNVPYGLTGIVYEKIHPYVNKLEIKIDNKIDFDIFNFLKPRRYNVLVEKLVLMIDNALEASMLSVDKVVIINMYLEDDTIVIEVKNSFKDSIDVDSLGKLSYSTKSHNRGFGLFTIFRDNEVSVNVKIINNMFVAKLVAIKNNLN